jgi:hypothetical protein
MVVAQFAVAALGACPDLIGERRRGLKIKIGGRRPPLQQ